MTVPSSANRSGPYNGNGVTTFFNYGFRILDENHLTVIKTVGGVETVLTIDADYVVSDVGADAGGQIAVTPAPASGSTITILRNVPFTQETDLENQGAYFAETIEGALDRGVMRDQQLSERLDRTVTIPASADSSTLDELIEDVLRLADSADAIDTVAANVGAVNTAATNIAAIIDAPNQASAAAASAVAAGDSADAAAASAAAALDSQNAAASSADEAAGVVAGALQAANNLSDVSSPTLAAGNLKLIERDTVALLLADTILDYSVGAGKTAVTTDQIVKAGGFRYKVAASGASDHHVTTAGGVKLYVLTNAEGRFNVLAFGAAWDGVTDDAAILQKCIDTGPTLLPFGSVKVASSIILPNKANIIGMGQLNTNIVSGVIGASTIKTTGSSVAYVYLAGFSMTGNGLTGASGNGHAINFIDPAIDSGTHTPQNCLIERVSITGFKGNDVRDNGALTIEACAYIGVDGVHNTCRKMNVSDCGHGFYFYRSQNCRVEDCVAADIMKSALIVMDCENVIGTRNDFVGSSDGVASTNYPIAGLSVGVVTSAFNEGFVLENTKIKTPNGGPLIVANNSHGDVLFGNWLRAENLQDAVGRGIYTVNCSGTRILANTFSPTGGVYGRKAQNIEIYTTQTNMGIATTIEGNTFLDISGGTIEWNVKLTGNAQTRAHNAVSIRNNNFGDSGVVGSAATVEADILIASCTVRDSTIAYNKHTAVTNVTRTAGLKIGASVTLSNNAIGPNSFLANGGTITANYDGITESVLNGSATFDPPSIAAGAGTQTNVTVTGAALGDFVEASFSLDTPGIILTGWVTAADTVRVRLQNGGGSPVDLGSGTLRVRVRKA